MNELDLILTAYMNEHPELWLHHDMAHAYDNYINIRIHDAVSKAIEFTLEYLKK